MSEMDSFFRRLSPKRLINGDPPPPPPSPLPPGGGQAVGASDLQERRDQLARELAELQWDLGGLAYEMAIRDHFRLDVLMRQAGKLQEVDARLGEVEHLLRLDTTGAAGACPRCGTLYARGALFCSQCAFQLVGVQTVGAPAGTAATPAEGAVPVGPGGPTAGPEAYAPAPAPAPASPDAPYGFGDLEQADTAPFEPAHDLESHLEVQRESASDSREDEPPR